MALASVAIGKAIQASLEANGAFAPSLTAPFGYRPRFTREELTARTIFVAPGPEIRRNLTRGGNERIEAAAEVGVFADVAIDNTSGGVDQAEADAAADLIDQIKTELKGEAQAGFAWIRTEHDPLYDATLLKEKSVFLAVARFVYLKVAT